MKSIEQITDELVKELNVSDPYIECSGYFDYYVAMSGFNDNDDGSIEYYDVYIIKTRKSPIYTIDISHTTDNPRKILTLIEKIEPEIYNICSIVIHDSLVERNTTENEPVKPILREIYTDNGDISHYVLIDPNTGDKLWSQLPEECEAMGYPVKSNWRDLI